MRLFRELTVRGSVTNGTPRALCVSQTVVKDSERTNTSEKKKTDYISSGLTSVDQLGKSWIVETSSRVFG